MLSQAYAALHAEYVSLKTSQLTDQAYHPAQYDVAAAYGSSANGPGMGLGTGGHGDGLDMDVFVYQDMTAAGGYTL